MNLSNRIRETLSISGKSQAAIAREMGITQSAITQWLTGQTKKLRADTAVALEKATGVKAEWIATGHGPKLVSADQIPKMVGYVPLVSWRKAALWASDENEVEGEDQPAVDVPSPIKHSDHAYALRVRGVSMLNPAGPISFAEDDLIFVEQFHEARHGSFVVARLSGESEAILRQLIVEGSSKYLQALNPAWPQRILDATAGGVEIGGVVVARVTLLS